MPTRTRFSPKERAQIARILRLGKGNKYSTIADIEGRVFRICSLKDEQERPKRGKEKEAIRRAYKAAIALQKELEAAEKVLWRFYYIIPLLEDLRPIVINLKNAADKPLPPGREPNEKFKYLVKWLEELFEAMRKKPAKVTVNSSDYVCSGDFFSLVEICVAPWKQMSNVALGQAIKRVSPGQRSDREVTRQAGASATGERERKKGLPGDSWAQLSRQPSLQAGVQRKRTKH